MRGCNCSFIIEKWPFIEWIAATGIANKLNIFEKRDDCKCLFHRNAVPLKKLEHCKWSPELITVPLKYMTAGVPL